MILYMILLKCALMPADAGCTSAYDPHRPPPIERMPIVVTTYWTYNDDGIMMDGWNGQCNADCSTTADGTKLDPSMAWETAACISAWVGQGRTRRVQMAGYGDVVCHDAFGALSHRQPHFNERLGLWVVPVDIFAPVPLLDVVWAWSEEMER